MLIDALLVCWAVAAFITLLCLLELVIYVIRAIGRMRLW